MFCFCLNRSRTLLLMIFLLNWIQCRNHLYRAINTYEYLLLGSQYKYPQAIDKES